MAESPEARKRRHQKIKEKMAADPEYAEMQRRMDKVRKDRYLAKKKMTRQGTGAVGSGKPGRIVALCGWERW